MSRQLSCHWRHPLALVVMLAALVVGIVAGPALAQVIPVGSELRVNTTTPGDQVAPSIGMAADGRFVIAWQSEGQDGDGYGVYARRYAPSGAAQGDEVRVNTTTAGSQLAPAVAMASDGQFVVAWQSFGQDGAGYGVYARRYAAGGAAQGDEVRVNTTTAGHQLSSAVAMASDGRFVVAWQSDAQDGAGYGVYARRYAAGGAAEGDEVRVNTTTPGSQFTPAVAMAADGRFVVAWQSFGQDGSYAVFAQQYAIDGSPQGSELRVNATAASSQLTPSVATAADGQFAVAWELMIGRDQSDNRDEIGFFDVFARRFAADGAPQGGEFRVNTVRANDQLSPAVAMASDGRFVVAWQSEGQDGNQSNIFAQRYRANSILTVTRAGSGMGAVTSSPGGINCGQNCEHVYSPNTVVTLTATPFGGSTFAGWSGGCTNAVGPCVVTMDVAKSVTATFTDPNAPVRISGRVLNGTAPVSNVEVSTVCTTAAEQTCPGVVVEGRTTVDGTYVVHGPVGRYDLYVVAGDTATVSSASTIFVDAAGAGDYPDRDIPVGATVAVAGTVTDADSGAVVGSARLVVTIPRQGGSGTVTLITETTAADGTYATKLAPGIYSATLSKAGYLAQAATPFTVSGATSAQNFTMEAPATLTVARAGSGSGGVTSSPAGISCGGDCTQDYGSGTTVTLTAQAAAGSIFGGWSGGGCSGTTATCQVVMNQSMTVTATFTPAARLTTTRTGAGTVTSNPPGIDCGSICAQDVALTSPATVIALTATPDPGWGFSGWGGACSGTGPCTVTMDQARTVTATFAVLRTLTVTRSGDGTVTSQPASINCGTTCSATFPNGVTVVLTATPAAGYAFAGWSGSGCSGTGTCTVTMTANRSVTATFGPTLSLTGMKSEDGAGACAGPAPTCTDSMAGARSETAASFAVLR